MSLNQQQQHQQPIIRTIWTSMCALVGLFCFLVGSAAAMMPHNKNNAMVLLAGYRREYDMDDRLQPLQNDMADQFSFGRFQSPESIQKLLGIRKRFRWYRGKDGRHGNVSSTKLGGDWVLAESSQIAPNCTTTEIIQSYLSGVLQKEWNQVTVVDCRITPIKIQNQTEEEELKFTTRTSNYYQQDLVLKSQRVLTSKTGIMRYSQTIAVDQIGNEKYCVSIKLDPTRLGGTKLRPFDQLHVYVGVEPYQQHSVKIYAAGIMKVNRKVVPNLVVFDASGIAGSMAGKGTLWLAAYFEKKQKEQTIRIERSATGILQLP